MKRKTVNKSPKFPVGLTFQHWDLSDELLSEEVVHLYHVILILDVNVDGEMSVHRLHLVLESL